MKNAKIKTSCSRVFETSTGVKKFEIAYENIIENDQDVDKEISKSIELAENSLDKHFRKTYPSTEDKMAFVLYSCNFLRECKTEEEVKHLVTVWKGIRKEKNKFASVKEAYKISKIIDKIYNSY
jgi:hypothetical protein